MSRRRLRGVVTPPVSMLMDSDSDSDLGLNEQVDYEQFAATKANTEVMNAAGHTQANKSVNADFGVSYSGLYETDLLDFDSDEADLDGGEPVSSNSVRLSNKAAADKENLRIQQSGKDMEYRHYYEGMVLRSGSHLKGVKRFLDSRDPDRRKTTSIINHMSADTTSNALEVHSTSAAGAYDQRRRSDIPRYEPEYTTTTTTTVTKTVTEIDEDELNTNNSARPRLGSRSPTPKRRGRPPKYSDSDESPSREYKRVKDERQREKRHRLKHMYDTDSYGYTTSSLASSRYGDRYSEDRGFLTRSFMFVTSVITVIVESLFGFTKPVTGPVWYSAVCPVLEGFATVFDGLWTQITNLAKCFIVLDTWLLSRNTRRGCCLCLPLLLFLPAMFYGGHYVTEMVSAGSSSLLSFTPSFFSYKTTSFRSGDTLNTINLQHEVKQILMQLQSERRDWLSKPEIEKLVKGMLKPEIESLRVTLLNIAKEEDSEQAVLKVDQTDAKVRLSELEQKLAALQTKTKLLENDLEDAKNSIASTLTADREKQTKNLVYMEKELSNLRDQVNSLQSAYTGVSSRSKNCCLNDTGLVAAVQNNVNQILTEMFGGNNKNKGSAGAAFAGWLNQNFIDRNEFDNQLRRLTQDISKRISAGIEAQRYGHTSSIVLPSRAGSLSEEAVKLIVEDALLKYSADRTGMTDYALESAGGSVVSTRCSETYYRKTALISVFGIPLWYTSNSPRTVIQPDVHPGQCWAFKGQSGFVVIQLSVPVRPTGFSLEHIPKSLSTNGSIDSAPRDFTVIGLESEKDMKGLNLGNFTYETYGKPLQTFDVQVNNPGVFGFIELRVLNNHGNKEYTCLYRFRVHGVPST